MSITSGSILKQFDTRQLRMVVPVIGLMVMVAILGPLYGVIPLGGVQSLGILYWALGFIDCFTNNGTWLVCPDASLPGGLNLVFGLPMAMLASAVQRLTGAEPLIAYSVAGLVFLGIGIASCFKLLLHFGVERIWAVIGTLLFYSLPIVHGKASYVFLMWGFVMFPATIFSIVFYWRSESRLIAFTVLVLSLLLALFQEPYSFVMAVVFGFVWTMVHALHAPADQRLTVLIRIGGWLVACAIAVAAYKVYVPSSDDFAVMPVDFFRGQGIDLIAFNARSSGNYLFDMPWAVSDLVPQHYFSDGESVAHTYLGIGISICVIAFLAAIRFWKKPTYLAVTVVAFAALLLSLGPSLKIDDHRDIKPNSQYTFQDYLMPEGAATLALPHRFVYGINPINKMRAVSRWYLLFSMMAVIVVAIILSRAASRPTTRILGIGLVVWLGVEYAPNYESKLQSNANFAAQFNKFNEQAVVDLSKGVTKGETVLFMGAGGADNEYLSLYLCEQVGCKTYNAPGDKALADSWRKWPAVVGKAAATNTPTEDRPDLINALLQQDLADVVVIPNFDLRWDSYQWPPASEKLKATHDQVVSLYSSSEQVCVESNELFTFIRRCKP